MAGHLLIVHEVASLIVDVSRSNVLHYQKNNQLILPDDLVMLDAGGILKQYASDITRLWPINGTV